MFHFTLSQKVAALFKYEINLCYFRVHSCRMCDLQALCHWHQYEINIILRMTTSMIGILNRYEKLFCWSIFEMILSSMYMYIFSLVIDLKIHSILCFLFTLFALEILSFRCPQEVIKLWIWWKKLWKLSQEMCTWIICKWKNSDWSVLNKI